MAISYTWLSPKHAYVHCVVLSIQQMSKGQWVEILQFSCRKHAHRCSLNCKREEEKLEISFNSVYTISFAQLDCGRVFRHFPTCYCQEVTWPWWDLNLCHSLNTNNLMTCPCTYSYSNFNEQVLKLKSHWLCENLRLTWGLLKSVLSFLLTWILPTWLVFFFFFIKVSLLFKAKIQSSKSTLKCCNLIYSFSVFL